MSKIFTTGILAVSFLLVPESIFAAELTFKKVPDVETTGNSVVVEVRIDPQSKSLNVVEGEIKFSGSAAEGLVVQVENGQSILPIWPTAPVYDADKKSISFTGGVPNGFNAEGLLFRLRFDLVSSGNLNMSYKGNAYLNDGKGTKENVHSKYFEISVGQSADDKASKQIFDFMRYKYATIILLTVAVLIFIYRYGFRKNHIQ